MARLKKQEDETPWEDALFAEGLLPELERSHCGASTDPH
jgi:hypothetical protein